MPCVRHTVSHHSALFAAAIAAQEFIVPRLSDRCCSAGDKLQCKNSTVDSAPNFAFLPGASGRGDFWSTVAVHFDECTSLTFDWPGFGDVPADANRELSSYDDLATLVIEQLEKPTVLVSQSMGGVVAAMVAKRRPDLVSHIVLAATSGGVDLSSLGATDWRPSSRVANPTNPHWMWDERPDMTETLRNLKVPVLLVWATDDPVSPLSVGEHLNKLIPHARLVVFECADHWVARIHGDEVAREIHALTDTK
jgi:pimeloyl-ACP methyl ester carboxylesterase